MHQEENENQMPHPGRSRERQLLRGLLCGLTSNQGSQKKRKEGQRRVALEKTGIGKRVPPCPPPLQDLPDPANLPTNPTLQKYCPDTFLKIQFGGARYPEGDLEELFESIQRTVSIFNSSQSFVMLSTEDDPVATGKTREPYAFGIYESAATAPDWLL
ncbi:hypothetical protein STEG23_011305 [Scotinomys teguina]